VVLSDQIKNADWRARQATYIGAVPTAVLADIVAKFVTLLPGAIE
jgi:mRNA-degrading endonuclease toxin of MazEF toxin-antitoxin module